MTNEDGIVEDQKIDEELGSVKLDEIDTEAATPEQVETVVKTAKTALVQRAKWKERAIDPATGKSYKDLLAEAQAKPTETTKATPQVETQPETETRLRSLEVVEEKRNFGHANSLSPEETDHLYAYAQGRGIKPKEALESPFFKSALDSLRSQRNVDDAVPSPSSRLPKVEGKTFKEMTPDERRKNFSKLTGSPRK